jgi:hypothetical protein
MKLIPNFAEILLLSFLATNCGSKKEVKISSFYVVNYVHTLFANSKTYYYRQDNFLVENYIENFDSFAKIKEFACQNKHKKSSTYDSYEMVFYRKSLVTNNDNIFKNRKQFDRYSLVYDYICTFTWSGKSTDYQLKKTTKEEKYIIKHFNCTYLKTDQLQMFLTNRVAIERNCVGHLIIPRVPIRDELESNNERL